MKTWLGVLGRAAVEFLLALLLLGLAGALSSSLVAAAASTMLAYLPLAGLVALLLSFFTVEFQIEGRLPGLLALLLISLIPLAGFIYLERLPIAQSLRPTTALASSRPLPARAGTTIERDGMAAWIGSWEGNSAKALVTADFRTPPPHLRFSPRAVYSPEKGTITIGTANFPASMEPLRPVDLVPEASVLAPWLIWSRLTDRTDLSLLFLLATAAGFGVLASALRIFARLTAWPLANAFLAVAGLAGLLVIDALMSTPEAFRFTTTLFSRLRIGIAPPLILPLLEGGLGLFIALMDLLVPPGHRRNSGE